MTVDFRTARVGGKLMGIKRGGETREVSVYLEKEREKNVVREGKGRKLAGRGREGCQKVSLVRKGIYLS